MDARMIAGSHAQILRWLCGLNDMLGKARIALEYAYPYISPEPVSSKEFINVIAGMNQDISTRGLIFVTVALQLLSTLASGNEYVSALGTNVVPRTTTYTPDRLSFSIISYQLENGDTCSCYPTASCSIPAALYFDVMKPVSDLYPVNTSASVKGMRSDCYPFNGLLASSLECYFDVSCLALLVSNTTPFQPLNAQLTSRFPSVTPFALIASQLMIEQVTIDASIDDYFSQCNCAKCTYDYRYRNSWLGIVTDAIGLISGVNTALRLIIPVLIGLIYKLLIKKLKKTVPTVFQSTQRLTGQFHFSFFVERDSFDLSSDSFSDQES